MLVATALESLLQAAQAEGAAAAVASVGFAATLLLQERLIALTGENVRGQALGLHVTGMKAMQTIGATPGESRRPTLDHARNR
ncbi:hypothetical protein GCM10009555_095300 [Acrocarpospora macrocephala]|uniref:Uncharacterized protein n=1 Tax=Acrocarpospora macrocephala TaxID=150177 RepID=A0A5M3WJY6_9ACTN|nr:hypothetical protein [Acrocarpospora macrocephala]GES09525.1 hypothetical protein Amac_031210 [Acrocarpospora macrocephala]